MEDRASHGGVSASYRPACLPEQPRFTRFLGYTQD